MKKLPPAKSNNEKIIDHLKARLEFGAKEHGKDLPLDGSRKHLKDALEEALDLAVYLTAQILELQDIDFKIYKKEEYLCYLQKQIDLKKKALYILDLKDPEVDNE